MKKITDYPAEFFSGKRVLVRVDYNVPLREEGGRMVVADDSRIRLSLPTIQFLVNAGARVILISHLGRPEKEFDPKFSLAPVAQKLNELAFGLINYQKKILFSPDAIGSLAKKAVKKLVKGQVLLLENLRFYQGEEDNDSSFTKRLAKLADFYVNDAFSASHRAHASVVGLPGQLPAAAGLALAKEVDSLGQILVSSQRPLVMVVGGVKEDKLVFASQITNWADQILLGGRLPEKIDQFPDLKNNCRVLPAVLNSDGQDLSAESISQFKKVIGSAKTVIFAGPVSNVDQGHWQGTRELFESGIASGAFLIAGGGDTEAALTSLGLVDKINYIASGGGAMLEFLANKTLPGIEALNKLS